MVNPIRKYLKKLLYPSEPTARSLLRYWQWRSLCYGTRAACNLALPPQKTGDFTRQQQARLFACLEKQLDGKKPAHILDFGCGPGRFSVALAERYRARVVAIDPVRRFLRKAPRHPDVHYLHFRPGKWPCPHERFDLIWTVHVLAGIPATDLPELANRFYHSLLPEGVFLLCEVTGQQTNEENDYWFLRPPGFYTQLLEPLQLRPIAQWKEFGQEVSLFFGKKP